MKKLLLLFSFILTMFVANSQTYVKDSVTQFRLPLSVGSFVFDKGTGQVYQILEQAEATDSLVSVNRQLSNRDTLSVLWRNDISDSILSVGGFSSTALTSDVNITGNYNVTFGYGDVFDDEARLTSFQIFTEDETGYWPWRSQFSMKKDEMPYLRQFQPSSPGGAYIGEHTFTGYGEPVLAFYRANFTPTDDSIVFGVDPIGAYLYDHDRGEKMIIETDRITLAGDDNYTSIDTNKLVPKKYVDRLVADSTTFLRQNINDSILSNKRTFSEILKENNSAGDNSITRVRSLSDLTSSITDSYASGIALSGSTLGGAGIAMQGSTIYGTGVGISGTSINLNSKAIGISANFINSTGVAMHSKLDSINGLSFSYDTLRGVNKTDSSIFVSVGGYKNLIYNNDTSKTHVSTTLINSDTSTVSSSSNFVGINLQNKTYEDLNNTTVIDRNLLLPGVVSSNAPASATDTGIKGEIRITADYIYVCVDTDTWVRSALSTW